MTPHGNVKGTAKYAHFFQCDDFDFDAIITSPNEENNEPRQGVFPDQGCEDMDEVISISDTSAGMSVLCDSVSSIEQKSSTGYNTGESGSWHLPEAVGEKQPITQE